MADMFDGRWKFGVLLEGWEGLGSRFAVGRSVGRST